MAAEVVEQLVQGEEDAVKTTRHDIAAGGIDSAEELVVCDKRGWVEVVPVAAISPCKEDCFIEETEIPVSLLEIFPPSILKTIPPRLLA